MGHAINVWVVQFAPLCGNVLYYNVTHSQLFIEENVLSSEKMCYIYIAEKVLSSSTENIL